MKYWMRITILLSAVLLMALAAGCTTERTAKAGDNVSVDYTVTFANGTVLDTSYAQVAQSAGIYNSQRGYAPLMFIIDNNTMIKGFNDAVKGMKVGETKNVTLPPEQAYGAYNESMVRQMAISDIEGTNNTTMTVGQVLYYSPDGIHLAAAYVKQVDQANGTVWVDYNHKLAGNTLLFQITLRGFN